MCRGLVFQLLDLPGIIEGAKDGKGRGKQVIAGNVTFMEIREIPTLILDRRGV